MTCHMGLDLGGYVLHALEQREEHAVEQHLLECDECLEELGELAFDCFPVGARADPRTPRCSKVPSRWRLRRRGLLRLRDRRRDPDRAAM